MACVKSMIDCLKIVGKEAIMFKKLVSSLLVVAAVTISFGLTEAKAGLPGLPGLPAPPGLPGPNVNVRVNGYMPAPPGVNVMIDSGRPYYVERDRRVYMERERPSKHYYKRKHHYEDRGRGHGRGHDRGRHDD